MIRHRKCHFNTDNILTETMFNALLIRVQVRPPPKARACNACRDQAVLPLYKVLDEMETIIEASRENPLQHRARACKMNKVKNTRSLQMNELRRVLIEMSVENFYTMAGPATSSSYLRCKMRPPNCKTVRIDGGKVKNGSISAQMARFGAVIR